MDALLDHTLDFLSTFPLSLSEWMFESDVFVPSHRGGLTCIDIRGLPLRNRMTIH